jgi:hypothetical protein
VARKHDDLKRRLKEYDKAYRELAAQLARTGYLWDGSVVRQRTTCGKQNCACRKDPSRRHGPYAYWSTKVKGRTVSRRLSSEEADLYEEWIANRRELERIKRKMIEIAQKIAPVVLQLRQSNDNSN